MVIKKIDGFFCVEPIYTNKTFTDKASKSEKSSAAVATAKKQQPKKKVLEPSEPALEPSEPVLNPAVEEVKVTPEKKKRAPRKKTQTEEMKIVEKEKFDLQFPRKEFNTIMKFLKELDTSGEVEGLGEHIAAMQSGLEMVIKAQHAANNEKFEDAHKIFGNAWVEYFWDAFDAIDSFDIIPYDLEADWEKMKEEIDDIDERLIHVYNVNINK